MTTPIRMRADGNPETGFVPSTLVAAADFTTADTTEINSGFYQNEDERYRRCLGMRPLQGSL